MRRVASYNHGYFLVESLRRRVARAELHLAQNRVDFASDTVDIVGTLHSWRNSQKRKVSKIEAFFSYLGNAAGMSRIKGEGRENRIVEEEEEIGMMTMGTV